MAQLKDFRTDRDAVTNWQKTKDTELLASLISRYQPAVRSVSNKYGTTAMNQSSLRAVGQSSLVKALKTYDNRANTEPITHVYNYMQRVQRSARDSLMSGSVPEHRSTKMSIFNTVKSNLEDQFGHEPNVHQLSDALGWSVAETERMSKEMSGETQASNSISDFFGHSTAFEHKDRALVDYLYLESSPREKTILEHTFGYGGKPILSNKGIAQKLGTYDMEITRMKKKMSDKIKANR